MIRWTGKAIAAWFTPRAVLIAENLYRQQLHGALEVREEDGHLLALTFEGSLGRQDSLGEVLGRV